MLSNDKPFVTLGDKLHDTDRRPVTNYWQLLVTLPIIGLLSWWAFETQMIEVKAVIVVVLCVFILIIAKPLLTQDRRDHFLVRADKQGFMKSLKLADKTIIIDGSNIYHFGLKHGLGAKALKTLVGSLRSDGYRLVCFFDANIYFTLKENGQLEKYKSRFSVVMLHNIFGLEDVEIYVVPSGIQADKFIIESISLLPKSFALTNDKFRDYEAEYDFLAKDLQWRKGVWLRDRELLLYQYNFKPPLMM